MLKEFRAFVLRGNLVDLAVAVVIGAAFTAVVNALVKNLITPLIAWVEEGVRLAPNPAEVESVYRVPLADLGREGSPQFVSIPESERPVIRYPLLGSLIHAPTAAVLYQFMEVAVLGRETRVAHLEQPVWAWR